jgi:uncharacterized protein (TIGR02996 family)
MGAPEAENELRRGNEAQALALLLEAWKASRAGPVAQAIELLSARMLLQRPPRLARRDDAQTLWLEHERGGDLAERGQLVSVIGSGTRREAEARLDRMRRWAPDPRTSAALVKVLEAPPWSGAESRELWRTVFTLVVEIADPRAVPPLWSVAENGRRLGGSRMERFMTEALIETARAIELRLLDVERPLDDEPAEACARIIELLHGGDSSGALESLLAGVYARPADDARRLVLADWLLEHGDVWGEFIALQFKKRGGELTDAQARWEKKLIGWHERRFLGPLAPVVQPDSARFERGFVTHCRIATVNDEHARKLSNHPAWATLGSYQLIRWPARYRKELELHLRALGAHVHG